MGMYDSPEPTGLAGSAPPGTTGSGERVELSVPMHPRWAATVRLLAASMAADLGFSVDEIDDLRLAVSEAVALVAAQERPGDRLDVSVMAVGDSISIEFSARSGRPPTEPDDLAANVLRAVTDHYEVRDGTVRTVSSTLRLGPV